MAYVLYQFDGLEIPRTILDGDDQNIGTGSALTAFSQLPGGGFFDHYGRRKSPQGIRPITKSGVVNAASASEARAQLDALRAKLGILGKLTAQFDDGSMRWQWARLQSVDTPRRSRDNGNLFPYELTFISAAQHWYGLVYPNGWTWGDGTWIWGDGTAQFGQAVYSGTVASPPTITHDGNIDAVNVQITTTFAEAGLAGFTIINNGASGNRIEYNDDTNAVAVGDVLKIDCGARSCALHQKSAYAAITNIYGLGDFLDITTAAVHGVNVGDTIAVEGTDNYDGVYTVAVRLNATWIRVAVEQPATGAGEAVGMVYPVLDRYSYLTVFDRARWFALAPGSNPLGIQNIGALDSANMAFSFSFYDHYA